MGPVSARLAAVTGLSGSALAVAVRPGRTLALMTTPPARSSGPVPVVLRSVTIPVRHGTISLGGRSHPRSPQSSGREHRSILPRDRAPSASRASKRICATATAGTGRHCPRAPEEVQKRLVLLPRGHRAYPTSMLPPETHRDVPYVREWFQRIVPGGQMAVREQISCSRLFILSETGEGVTPGEAPLVSSMAH